MLSLAQGHNYGMLSEDQNQYSVVLINQTRLLTITPHQGAQKTIFVCKEL